MEKLHPLLVFPWLLLRKKRLFLSQENCGTSCRSRKKKRQENNSILCKIPFVRCAAQPKPYFALTREIAERKTNLIVIHPKMWNLTKALSLPLCGGKASRCAFAPPLPPLLPSVSLCAIDLDTCFKAKSLMWINLKHAPPSTIFISIRFYMYIIIPIELFIWNVAIVSVVIFVVRYRGFVFPNAVNNSICSGSFHLKNNQNQAKKYISVHLR